jgi:hypothetical protein
MHPKTDDITWKNAADEDLWLFDKLILARTRGYVCGPVGVDVPKPGYYVIRPITNILGMGRGAFIQWIEQTTDSLPVGYFWCEVFTGRHLSVDYVDRKQSLCVEGFRDEDAPLYKWDRWEKVNDKVTYPFNQTFPLLNCEFIGGKLIEVHFRLNPDFREGYKVIHPIWDGEFILWELGLPLVEDREYLRRGFLVEKEQ